MPLVYLAISFVVLLILIIWLRFSAFFALLVAALLAGLLSSMPFNKVVISISKGIGDTMGSLVLILVFGAMLGKMLEESGAAHRITYSIVDAFGRNKIQLAILLAGFVIGLPMMYNASFLMMIPIAYSFCYVSKVPLIQLGIPLSASLSVAHAFLPPHPAPVVVSEMYGASINTVFVYGFLFSIPAIAIAGGVLPKFFKNLQSEPPAHLYTKQSFDLGSAPSFTISLLCALLPFILISLGAILPRNYGFSFFQNIAIPEVALFIAVMYAVYFLGIKKGKTMDSIMTTLGGGVQSITNIVLIIAAGGAFKQVIIDSGVSEYIKLIATGLPINPILLGWLLAAFIRLAIGSATVATITAASILLPMVQASNVSPELMVLATGSGSLMFSHLNDIGFWMFKEYYNVSIKQTFAIWTAMESLVGMIGLAGCLIADQF